jgi:hypothetical protein
MKGFPKKLETGDDIKNCLDLVNAGKLEKADLHSALLAIEKQNYINAPIRALSDDRKTATIGYCNEAAAGGAFVAGSLTGTIKTVTHIEGKADPVTGEKKLETSDILLSRAITAGTELLQIVTSPDIYGQFGYTAEDFTALIASLE